MTTVRPHRPKAKLEAAERVVAGETPGSVAASLGASADLVERWHRAYVRAGKAALRYTNDEGEVPSLEALQRAAQRAFPTRLLHGCESAACFFCAQFYGKNDVVHIYNSGIPAVTLVDLDAEKLAVMKAIYPEDWEVVHEDAFEAAHRFEREGRTFDVVLCDPFSDLAPSVAWDHLSTFLPIAGRTLIQLYTHDMLDTLGAEPTAESVSGRLAERLGRPVPVAAVIKRSSHAGGVYWCVIRVSS